MCNLYSITINQAASIATFAWSTDASANSAATSNTRTPMTRLDPDVADLAPSDPALTVYDEEHAITYVRMLDANAEGADVARIVIHIDPKREPDRAWQTFESHLAQRQVVGDVRSAMQSSRGAQRCFAGIPRLSKDNAPRFSRRGDDAEPTFDSEP